LLLTVRVERSEMPLADQHPRACGFLLLRQHAARRPALLRGPHKARLPAGLPPARRAKVRLGIRELPRLGGAIEQQCLPLSVIAMSDLSAVAQ